MELAREVRQVTIESVREAVTEFFRPVWAVQRWLRALWQIPKLFSPLEGLPALLLQQEKTLAALLELEDEIRSISRSVQIRPYGLKSLTQPSRDEVTWLSGYHASNEPWLGRELTRRYETLDERVGSVRRRVGTERKIFRYLTMADDFWRRGDIEHANEVLLLLVRIGERHQLGSSLIYVWFNLGELSFEQNKLSLAERYFQRVIKRDEAHDFEEVLAAAYSRLALVYHHEKRFEKTADYAKRALEIFGRNTNRDVLWQSYLQLATALVEEDSEIGINALEKDTERSLTIGQFLLPTAEFRR